jgi:mono/diheme cytochrome c family protein
MKSSIKVVASLLLVTVGAFAFVSSPAKAGSAAIETSALASAYGTHCARCHGADGKANTAKGRELDADDLTTGKVQGMSTAKLTNIIKHGKGDMPAFPKLTSAQISQIIRTVKSF